MKRPRIPVAATSLTVLATAVIFLGGWVRLGSLEALGRLARGERVFLVNSVSDLGRVAPGGKFRAGFVVTNLSSEDVHVIGTQASCSCTLVESAMPVRVPSGGSMAVAVRVVAPRKRGGFRYSLDLLTDNRDRPRIGLSVKGAVTEP